MYKWKFSYFDQHGRLDTLVAILPSHLQEDARSWFENEGKEKHNLNQKCKLIKCWITI